MDRRPFPALLSTAFSRRSLLLRSATGLALTASLPLLAACGDDDDDGDADSDTGSANTPAATSATGSTGGAGGAATTSADSDPTDTTEPATEAATEPEATEPTEEESEPTAATSTGGNGITRDELIVGVQALPATIDPQRDMGNVGTRVTYTPYDMPIRRDFLNNNEHVPSLAESWEMVSDTEMELALRQDVTFHDGSPFTAADIEYTYNRVLSAEEGSPLTEAKTYFASFESVTATDEYTVRIKTLAPDPLLVKRLASWGSWVTSKAYVERVGQDEFARTGMGTGPFAITKFDPEVEMIMERHDGYWGGPVPVGRVVFRVIPELAARVTALVNGEIDIATNIPPDQANSLSSQSGIDVRSVALANTHVLVYNTNQPQLSNKLFRQALNLGIDRQLIIDTIWSGQAVPKRSHQFEEYGNLYNPDRPLTPYDPERAMQLLEEAGYDGAEIEYQLEGSYYTNGEQVGEAIVQMWNDIGINAVIRISDEGISGAERVVHTWSNSSRLADPDGSLFLAWGLGSGTQKNYWKAPEEFNTLGSEAKSILDEERRYELYQQMLDIWEDEAPGTVLFDPMEFYGVSKTVNWQPYSFYYMDLRPYNLSFSE